MYKKLHIKIKIKLHNPNNMPPNKKQSYKTKHRNF